MCKAHVSEHHIVFSSFFNGYSYSNRKLGEVAAVSVPPPKTALAGRPVAGRVAMPVWRINRELQGGKVVSMEKVLCSSLLTSKMTKRLYTRGVLWQSRTHDGSWL